MSDNATLKIDLDVVEIEEIEVFLQEGSRGAPEFAASCSTICHYLCCQPSCNCVVLSQDQPASDADEMDEVFAD